MGDTPRVVYLPYLNDYDGGPQRPAFTGREACEQHVADLNAAHKWALYEVEEFPLLDAAPQRVTWHNQCGRVHWDGHECPESEGATMQHWDFEVTRAPEAQECAYGVRVNVWRRSAQEARQAYAQQVAQLRVRTLAGLLAGRPQPVSSCGRGCTHPAVAMG